MLLQILTVQHESASWFWDAIRTVFWFLAKGALILLDGLFLVIDDIWEFKFFDNAYVNKIYSSAIIVACTWLILKVILEFITHHIVNQDNNSSPLSLFKGVIISIVMMFLIPTLFTWGYNVSSKLTHYVISASSSAETSPLGFESTMSSMILTAFADDSKMDETDKTYFIENWFTADYNEVMNDGLFDGGEYKYSFNTFPILLVGLLVAILLFFVGIQVAKRVIELALYKAIAPFVCTSLVSNRSRSFEIWTKGVIGTFLVTAVQYLCIGILFNVFGTVISGTTYATSVILIVIGALLFIISSPSLVTTLLNANTGALSNMNELSTLMAVGTSMVAMSKYGKTSASSSNTDENNDNSTNNGDNTNSSGSGPEINNTGTSNLESTSQDNSSNEDNSNLSNSNTDTASSNSDLSSTPTEDTSYTDIPNIETTSLSDRIDVYKDFTDTNYNTNNESTTLYKTNIDWRNKSVFNTKEHKS